MTLHSRFESLFRHHGPLIACLLAGFLGALFALAVVAVMEGVR